ncbi:DUF3108 domain-containing protein [Lysobacter gummosus]|uniref:DUF3108 domain-containing protein n=1 Tax=Lysobacter gummosus TaxID=262324 RepID=A0ABY3XGK5_9GAMM|nr:DUF3108 domain-containing protein [Lysobacter gummosus]ALN90222.1 hypothetical protein LG3211_1246 [Lysobacter gummosus]UNP30772.1 DUF3108 domain-containing protein [Lysobacter gummosus]
MKSLLPLFLAALTGVAAPGSALALEPFVANYQVFNGGKALGDATMQVKSESGHWRIDLDIRAEHGMMGFTGAAAQQSTLFDLVGDTYRPLSQTMVRKVLFSKRTITGTYDWSKHAAQWSGDIKEHRRKPIALEDGDMSGLLINLAVVRDAQPGKTLNYRFVDSGRLRPHQYLVAQELEGVKVDDMSFNAMRVNRVQSGNEETSIWVVDGVPTPVRILQREDGQDTYDLRLVEYKGVNEQ